MITDNEVEMAMSSMINGKSPLLALNRLTSNVIFPEAFGIFHFIYIYPVIFIMSPNLSSK
jgi:hypothetical protein